MPSADRVLNTVRRAVDLTRSTPGRKGHLVHLRDCDEIMVVGDLHGNIANFQAILQRADLAAFPRRHLVFQEVVHGIYFYPDGGDKSHQLVDMCCALKCQYPTRVHYLPGNHEIAQLTGRKVGKSTNDLNALFQAGVASAYGVHAPGIYRAYMDLFEHLPLALRTPNRVFICHTVIPTKQLPTFQASQLEIETYVETDYQPGGIAYGILWGRDVSQATVKEFLRKLDADLLVTGHIAHDAGFHVPNDYQIIVECSESPGGYVLFPGEKPITHADLVKCIGTV